MARPHLYEKKLKFRVTKSYKGFKLKSTYNRIKKTYTYNVYV